MFLLPAFTVLMLTLPPLDAPTAWPPEALQPYFPPPSWGAGMLEGGIPPGPPARTAAVPAPRNPGRSAPGVPRPAPDMPAAPQVPMERMTEPVPRPTSPLGRRTGAADSMAPASFSLGGELFFVAHPWFGIIFIQSPGFVVEPGHLVTLPWIPPGTAWPVTVAEPGAILLEEPLSTIGQPGFVSWIGNF